MSLSVSSEHLLKDPIPKLILALGIPSAVGFFFNTMYNIVDTFVAGKVSPEALAGLSLTFPIFFLIIAFGSGVGTGTTSLLSNFIGAGNTDEAKRYAVQAISFGFFISIVLTCIGYFSAPYLFSMLSAKGEVLTQALLYMQPLFLGSIFFSMSFVFNAILNSVGDTKSYRNVLIAGFFINLVADPVLAFGYVGFPALGILGISLATVLSTFVGFVYLAYKVYRTGIMTAHHIQKHFLPEREPYMKIFSQGFPASLSMMTIALGSFVITYFVALFGPDAVAGYGTSIRIEQIFLIPGIGLTIAVLTLIGHNNGAKRFDRVKEVVAVAIKYSLIMSLVVSLCIYFLGRQLVSLFTTDENIIAYGVGYLSIAALISWAYGIIFVSESSLRGLKHAFFPLIIGILRQVVIPLPVFFFVTTLFPGSIKALWWSVFFIVWSGAIATYLYMRSVLKKESQAQVV